MPEIVLFPGFPDHKTGRGKFLENRKVNEGSPAKSGSVSGWVDMLLSVKIPCHRVGLLAFRHTIRLTVPSKKKKNIYNIRVKKKNFHIESERNRKPPDFPCDPSKAPLPPLLMRSGVAA
ncbi:hypothetical protein CEXT_124651 [Caerostris extrusa]|uniref:Uncharacterized protein n=1 Tax=Caerostris extrusa TaxID=172846 RepID=A0AAV4X3V0_CAEEX|nr:hypothetical protein CEXT_124651 [Caerostris extrusa]